METGKISWQRIVIFMIIGTLLSNIFRFDVFDIETELRQLPTWLFISISVLLEGGGVFIGALIAVFLLRKSRISVVLWFIIVKKWEQEELKSDLD